MHTLCFPIRAGRRKQRILEKGFAAMARCHNIVVKEAKKRLRMLRRDIRYRRLSAEYAEAKSKNDEKRCRSIGHKLKALSTSYGLSETSFHAYISKWQNRYSHLVSSHQAQAEASRVWAGVEKVLYHGADDIHFKKSRDMDTIASKSWNGLRYYDPLHMQYIRKTMVPLFCEGIEYLGEQFAVKIDWDDPYVWKSLDHEISYVQIARKMFASGWRYYVNLYLEGDAPVKETETSLDGTAGLDLGVSTTAAVFDDGCELLELAPEAKTYNRKLNRLSQQVERSMRQTNPDNYEPDGTIKKGKHKWVVTHTCRRKKRLLSAIFRKKAAYTVQSHNRQAIALVKGANTFIVEEMDFKALQKRSNKPVEKSEKTIEVTTSAGVVKTIRKNRRKRRFGSSIRDRAPSSFIRILEGKCKRHGGGITRVNTRLFRASQYDHSTDTYHKVPLSQRSKVVEGYTVQRDLYSAFLLKNSDPSGEQADRKACVNAFPAFLKHQEACIQMIRYSGNSYPACFGF